MNFEQVWRTRETYLDEIEVNEFHLMKGETNEEYTLYSSTQFGTAKMISSRGPNLNHSRKLIEVFNQSTCTPWHIA